LRIHGKKDEGPDFRKNYNIQGYPTVLFLNSEGEEIDRICGWSGDKEKYYETIVDYANGKNTVAEISGKLKNDSTNINLNYQLAMKYVARWEGELAKPYFEKILTLDPENVKGYQEEAICYLAVYEVRVSKNPIPLHNFLKTTKNEKLIDIGYNNLIRYFSGEKDQIKLLEAFEAVVTELPRDAGYLNRYAWYIYENKLAEKYNRGIELARKAVELKPESAGIWDTLAWLLFETGKVDDAIDCMKKAIELDPNTKYYQENLEKMEQRVI
jgi:tetratricopeptide (TPR) repeat protein